MLKKPSRRSHRIADLIRQQLAMLLKREINDPRLADVTITSITMAADLRYAKIYFTTLNPDDGEKVTALLQTASGRLRHLLAANVELRYTPQLIFVFDDVLQHAERLDQIIRQATDDLSEE